MVIPMLWSANGIGSCCGPVHNPLQLLQSISLQTIEASVYHRRGSKSILVWAGAVSHTRYPRENRFVKMSAIALGSVRKMYG